MKEYKAMKSLMKIMNYALPNCNEVAELASFSLDENLPFKKSVGLKLHIMMCKFCHRNYKQLYLIRKLIGIKLRSDDAGETEAVSQLSVESRQRISSLIKSNDTSHS